MQPETNTFWNTACHSFFHICLFGLIPRFIFLHYIVSFTKMGSGKQRTRSMETSLLKEKTYTHFFFKLCWFDKPFPRTPDKVKGFTAAKGKANTQELTPLLHTFTCTVQMADSKYCWLLAWNSLVFFPHFKASVFQNPIAALQLTAAFLGQSFI